MTKYLVIKYTSMLGMFGGREQVVWKTNWKWLAMLSRYFFLEQEYEEQYVSVFVKEN